MFLYNERINTSQYNLSKETVVVSKPYPGIINMMPTEPNTKIYCCTVDEFNYVMVVSNESDSMFQMLLKGLKVIPKAQAGSARLTSIARGLN